MPDAEATASPTVFPSNIYLVVGQPAVKTHQNVVGITMAAAERAFPFLRTSQASLADVARRINTSIAVGLTSVCVILMSAFRTVLDAISWAARSPWTYGAYSAAVL